MTIRIGRIPYLNSEVFYYGMAGEDVELPPLAPRALSSAAAEGRLDAGPLPVVTCFELEDRFVPLGDYCIATVERARSILLFSKRPIEQLDGATVAVTNETSTSARLLDTLFVHRYGVRAREYVSLDRAGADAFLLIGDAALRNRRGAAGYPRVYDLGEEWHRWTGLPFVFARWVVRRDLDAGVVQELDALVSRSMERGMAALDKIAQARTDLSMTPAEIIEYIESFRYRLGPPELRAIDAFRGLLAREDAVGSVVSQS